MRDPICKPKTGLTFLPALQTSWFPYPFRHSYIQNVFISTQSGLGTILGVESDMASVFMELIDHTGAFLVAQMVKNLPAMEETQVWPLGWEDPPGEGNGYPLQYSCLENPLDRGAWWATVHGVAKSWTRLSMQAQVLWDQKFSLHKISIPRQFRREKWGPERKRGLSTIT